VWLRAGVAGRWPDRELLWLLPGLLAGFDDDDPVVARLRILLGELQVKAR